MSCADQDGDGSCDADDPCPQDKDDRCNFWDQSRVAGGGCACNSPGRRGGNFIPLLAFALLALMGLGRGRKKQAPVQK